MGIIEHKRSKFGFVIDPAQSEAEHIGRQAVTVEALIAAGQPTRRDDLYA